MLLTYTQPATYPVTWAEMKAHLLLDDTSQKDYVMDLVAQATDYAEMATGRSLMQRTITATYYAYATPPDLTYLPRGPVISVTSVVDANGRTIANSVLEHSGNYARLRVNNGYSFPVNLVVTYEAGYATADAIPASIRGAIRQHAAYLFKNREGDAKAPDQLDAFYRQYSWEMGIG